MFHENIGNWRPVEGFIDHRPNRFFSIQRRNQEGFMFRSSTTLQNAASVHHLDDYVYDLRTLNSLLILNHFFSFFSFCSDVHIDPLAKVSYLVFSALMQAINGTVDLKIRNTYYRKEANGDLYGMIPDVILNRIDIGGKIVFFRR